MDRKLDDKLVNAFPNLYKQRDYEMTKTCMCWGFECGDGWFQLIWDLSEKLEALIVQYKKDNPDDDNFPQATQVKEKFGGLRFYMNYETEEIEKLIEEAEVKSEETCEVCGKKGTIQGGGWLMCLCPEHGKGK